MTNSNAWLGGYVEDAHRSDQLKGQPDHLQLISIGMFGEAGSILAEVKKARREGPVYPVESAKLQEEIGDFLWYFVTLASTIDPSSIKDLETLEGSHEVASLGNPLRAALAFGESVGVLLRVIGEPGPGSTNDQRAALRPVWLHLLSLCRSTGVGLPEAATANAAKREDRWPRNRDSLLVFDAGFPEEERFPRLLRVQVIERKKGDKPQVVLRTGGVNIGDRLTDAIGEPDGYRFHDVFHFGHAVFLGWSPVTRGLLSCKRKSHSATDENEDGGRALVVEEAISALVFGRAKTMELFAHAPHLDYDLLKSIRELTRGFEVERVPLWQWEEAILASYHVYRQMINSRGGLLILDFEGRAMSFRAEGSGESS